MITTLPRRALDPSVRVASWEDLEAVATRLEKRLDQLLSWAGTDRPTVLADFADGRAVDIPLQAPRARKAPATEQVVSSLPTPPRRTVSRPLFARVTPEPGAKPTSPERIAYIQRLAGLSPTSVSNPEPSPAPMPPVQEEDPEEAAVAAIVASSPRLNAGSRYRCRGEDKQSDQDERDPEDAFVASIVRHSPRLNAGSKFRRT